jgi:hypothetical protein
MAEILINLKANQRPMIVQWLMRDDCLVLWCLSDHPKRDDMNDDSIMRQFIYCRVPNISLDLKKKFQERFTQTG